MKIAFRVDASSEIGTGHFMRCLTLADGLKLRGAQTCFVSRHLPEYLKGLLDEKGHAFSRLEGECSGDSEDGLFHSHWLGVSQSLDAAQTLQALSGQAWDWLVVDHYALDSRWETALRGQAKKIMAIDDIADRPHDCDILLDQNLYADMEGRYAGKFPSHCRLLLGPRYALLRDEFRQWRERVKPRSGPVRRILVFFGGMDSNNHTQRAVEALGGIGCNVHVDVVIGGQHPCRERIETVCADYGYVCHIQTQKMAELMAAADLAIGAGGSAVWERCCLGLPSVAFCVAENQQMQIADAAAECILYAPDSHEDLQAIIGRHVPALADNGQLRHVISRRAMQMVDGRGIMRVGGCLLNAEINIRPVTKEDSRKLFEWRNHPSIRMVSRNSEVIDWHAHQDWFESVIKSANRLLLIGERNNKPVGVVRFDITDDEAEISIYIVPDEIGSGQGSALLNSAEQWLVRTQPNVSRIRAHVLGGNQRSRRLFEGAGYHTDSVYYLKQI